MEIRLLRYVMAVAEYRSFTQAARHLHIAQPSLSQQIAQLEHTLGMRLFVRGPGPVTLTADGRYFIQKAAPIVQLHEDMARALHERQMGMGTELVIGSPAITGGHLLPPVLSEYRARFPRVHVQWVEEVPETLENLLVHGTIDLAVLALPLQTNHLVTRPILTEPILAVLPAHLAAWMDTALQRIVAGGPEHFPLSQLTTAPFVLLKAGYGFRGTVLSLCAQSGFKPHTVYETSNIEVAQALVAQGHGVTLAPAMVRQASSPRLVYRRLTGDPTRTLVFAYRADRYLSRTATAFMDVMDSLATSEPVA
ncbi:MAG: LysR substrate-binding domain-containing protein [Thermaerobacter sp.]|nr:LysR substrate-binding domain-containing protein [Thermaerobacter sp.]